jgi:hypothetical protein
MVKPTGVGELIGGEKTNEGNEKNSIVTLDFYDFYCRCTPRSSGGHERFNKRYPNLSC